MWRTCLAGKKVLVLLGPTAVGKTSLALEIAQPLHAEIIGMDSRQIYRRMDIGTAKPTLEQQARVPHHLIDVCDPDALFSLADMQRLAFDAIDDVHRRGKLPMLVGGTGQYISAVIEGWQIPAVPPNESLRAELEAFATQHGAQALHERLRQLDPDSAKRIDYQNIRRVVRALEVSIVTGTPISILQQKRPPVWDVVVWGIDLPREILYARADQRVLEMLEAGLAREVRQLLDLGYARTLPSMTGLGYREFAAHLLDGIPLDAAIEATQLATHDFIRRQYTWFRKLGERVLWHNGLTVSADTLISSFGVQ